MLILVCRKIFPAFYPILYKTFSNSYGFPLMQEFNPFSPHLVLCDRKHFYSVLTDLNNLSFLFHQKFTLLSYDVKNVLTKQFPKMQNQPFANVLQKQLPQLQPATLLKKRLWQRCFPVNFAKFLRTPMAFYIYIDIRNIERHGTPFLIEHLWWLLLVLQNRCSYKFPNIHKKTSVLKSLFNTVRGLKACNHNKKETSTSVFL